MSDSDDAVAVAVAASKRVAASRLVRKEEIEVQLTKLKADRARVEAEAPGPEGDVLRQELDVRIEVLSGELATVVAEYRSALAEIAELKKLAYKSGAPAVIAAATADDPVLRSPEETALDNARAHLRDLEARASLGDESVAASEPPSSEKPISREDADAQALAAFKALREKRDKPSDGGGGGDPTPPKKTF